MVSSSHHANEGQLVLVELEFLPLEREELDCADGRRVEELRFFDVSVCEVLDFIVQVYSLLVLVSVDNNPVRIEEFQTFSDLCKLGDDVDSGSEEETGRRTISERGFVDLNDGMCFKMSDSQDYGDVVVVL